MELRRQKAKITPLREEEGERHGHAAERAPLRKEQLLTQRRTKRIYRKNNVIVQHYVTQLCIVSC